MTQYLTTAWHEPQKRNLSLLRQFTSQNSLPDNEINGYVTGKDSHETRQCTLMTTGPHVLRIPVS